MALETIKLVKTHLEEEAVASRTVSSGAGLSAEEKKCDKQDYLRTEHLLKNISGRAISGGYVTAAAQGLRFIIYMISTIILARLLSPGDFGLVAMVGTWVSLLRMFREAGLSTATIQRENITHAQISNLFWINLILGIIATIIGAAMGPAIAWFYRDQRLIAITAVICLSFLFSGAAVQHIAVLNRQMRFMAIALVDVAAMFIGLLVAVGMAWLGYGYWSLVGSQMGMSIAEVLLAWSVSHWRPQLPRLHQGTRSLLGFGASLTISNLVRRVAQGSDSLLLGRFYGAEALGLYSRAAALLMRPLDQFIIPFDVVFVPLLSRLQTQPARYRRVFLQAYNAVAIVSFPIAGLLLGLSYPIVLGLLGSKWKGVAPIFAWLSIAAIHIPLSYAAVWVLTTQGRGKDILITNILFSVTMLIAVFVGLPFGPLGVAIAFGVSGLIIRLPLQYYIVGRLGPVSTRDLWGVFIRHAPLCGIVFGASYLSCFLMASQGPFVQLCACGFVGVAAGSAMVLSTASQRRELMVLVNLLKGRKDVAESK
jgi:PST family polysaccharide transporter